MIILGIEEAKIGFFKKPDTGSRRLIQADAEGFEAVGSSAEGGSGAVSVLGNFQSGSSCNKGCGCGDIEAVRAVTAGSDNIYNLHTIRNLYMQRMFPHGRRAA